MGNEKIEEALDKSETEVAKRLFPAGFKEMRHNVGSFWFDFYEEGKEHFSVLISQFIEPNIDAEFMFGRWQRMEIENMVEKKTKVFSSHHIFFEDITNKYAKIREVESVDDVIKFLKENNVTVILDRLWPVASVLTKNICT